MTAKTIKKV